MVPKWGGDTAGHVITSLVKAYVLHEIVEVVFFTSGVSGRVKYSGLSVVRSLVSFSIIQSCGVDDDGMAEEPAPEVSVGHLWRKVVSRRYRPSFSP